MRNSETWGESKFTRDADGSWISSRVHVPVTSRLTADRMASHYAADLNEPLEGLDGSFDTAIASDVIEHLHTPLALFGSAARMLRPGGALIVGVHFLYWLHEQPHDHHRYTEFAPERMVVAAGLETVSLKRWGGGPEVVAGLTCKMAGQGRLGRLVYRTACWVLQLGLLRRLSARSAPTMPLGYLLVARKPGR